MGQADIRTSNAERDEAVTALGVHLSTGRLDLDEYEERCGRAATARGRRVGSGEEATRVTTTVAVQGVRARYVHAQRSASPW